MGELQLQSNLLWTFGTVVTVMIQDAQEAGRTALSIWLFKRITETQF